MAQMFSECIGPPSDLQPALQVLLDPRFTRLEKCILLRSQTGANAEASRLSFPDDTGFEAYVNHIHLENYVDASSGVCVLLEQAQAFGNELARIRSREGITEPFLFVIGAEGADVSVRFHVIRDGEDWLSKDLDSYEDAVAAFCITDAAPSLS